MFLLFIKFPNCNCYNNRILRLYYYTNNINILNVCVNTLKLNKPPYIPIPFSRGFMYTLLYAIKLVNNKLIITTLENSMDLSRLIVTALENNKKINNEINIKNKYVPCL